MKEDSKKEKQKDVKKKENLKMAEIEAILFASGDPVDMEKIQKFLKLKKSAWDENFKALEQRYSLPESGLQIVEKRGKIQLVTKASLVENVAKFLGKSLNEELSRVTLETLAVVAYRGPVTRAQVEYIRGVNCSFALRTLSLRGIIDRKENPLDSRSYLYEVSFKFLKGLGLKTVSELDNYEELKEQLPAEEEVNIQDDNENKIENIEADEIKKEI